MYISLKRDVVRGKGEEHDSSTSLQMLRIIIPLSFACQYLKSVQESLRT